jgi:putative transcriptional regulator
MTKRNLMAELTEGFDALGKARLGKQTLRTHVVEDKPAPQVTAQELLALRERLHLSILRAEHSYSGKVSTLPLWHQTEFAASRGNRRCPWMMADGYTHV